MDETPLNFRFDENIQLKTNSLVEAWLEIQWKLEDTDVPDFKRDSGFDIAIGSFFQQVRPRFPNRASLDASRLPQDMTPHVVRYQFRQENDSWPLLQLGPGVASVNFTTPYTWGEFRSLALYLREQLTKSYDQKLSSQALILRYRNAIPFAYSTYNLSEYLNTHLNISLQWPYSIPGHIGKSQGPIATNLAVTFSLSDNIGVGTFKVATGKKKEIDLSTQDRRDDEALIIDLEITSRKDNPPDLNDPTVFDYWLDSAHRVIHDWYFSLIEGPLRTQFEGT